MGEYLRDREGGLSAGGGEGMSEETDVEVQGGNNFRYSQQCPVLPGEPGYIR